MSGVDAEPVDHLLEVSCVYSAVAYEWGSREREPLAVLANADQTGAALLDDLAGTARRTAGFEPRASRPERGVAGEGELALRVEDAYAVVRVRTCWLQEERGLREVGPARERCHLLIADVVGVVDDGERVALGDGGGEHVDLAELMHAANLPRPTQTPDSPGGQV